jgi:hypothetical protein
MMIETPQSFGTQQECDKATWQNGFRRKLGEDNGWAAFGSTTVPGTVHIAASGMKGPWFLALDHLGVIEELDITHADLPGPGETRYEFEALGQLYATLSRVYRLSASLPDAPLVEFRAKTKTLPKTTEAERLHIQRIGQDIFRASLAEYWQSRCPLTGITDPALLRASHIIPWKDCETDAERLDVHNGLLLSALWDAAFDRGLVTFDDDGRPVFSPKLSEAARAALQWQAPIQLTGKHCARLAWHRSSLFVSKA